MQSVLSFRGPTLKESLAQWERKGERVVANETNMLSNHCCAACNGGAVSVPPPSLFHYGAFVFRSCLSVSQGMKQYAVELDGIVLLIFVMYNVLSAGGYLAKKIGSTLFHTLRV